MVRFFISIIFLLLSVSVQAKEFSFTEPVHNYGVYLYSSLPGTITVSATTADWSVTANWGTSVRHLVSMYYQNPTDNSKPLTLIDYGSNAANLTATAAVNAATANINALNGHPAITFSSVNAGYSSSSNKWNNIFRATGGGTVFFVIKHSNVGAGYILAKRGVSSSYGYYLRKNTGDKYYQQNLCSSTDSVAQCGGPSINYTLMAMSLDTTSTANSPIIWVGELGDSAVVTQSLTSDVKPGTIPGTDVGIAMVLGNNYTNNANGAFSMTDFCVVTPSVAVASINVFFNNYFRGKYE